jgi:NADP-dependent alcohol dehydrogenase
MNHFTFYNPTKILFGKGNISKIAEEIPSSAKVLITFGGGSIKKNGIYEQVTDALRNYKWDTFGGIEPNPKYETLMKAVEKIRSENFDFLLAIGGGSVIDGTKFIAAAVPFQGEPWDIVSKQSPIAEALPLATILTLPATGSESNAGGVITKNATDEKLPFGNPILFPVFSVLDPSVTATIPPRQAANGVTDAFVHVVEQYMTFTGENRLQERLAEGLLMNLIERGPAYYNNPADYDAAADIMWSATLALNTLLGAGVTTDWSTHMIGHELTALHGIDHARTLAVVLPGTWRVMKHNKKQKLIQYARRVWGLNNPDEEALIEEAILKTETFFHSLGIDTRLADYQVGEETIDRIVRRLEQRGWHSLGERHDVTPEKVRDILTSRL